MAYGLGETVGQAVLRVYCGNLKRDFPTRPLPVLCGGLYGQPPGGGITPSPGTVPKPKPAPKPGAKPPGGMPPPRQDKTMLFIALGAAAFLFMRK